VKYAGIVLLLVFVGVLCAYYYAGIHATRGALEPFSIHRAIMNGTALSPFRYRVLSAWLAEWLMPTVEQSVENVASIAVAYAFAHALVLPLMLLALFRWLCQWVSIERAALGVFMLVAYLPLMFQVWNVSLYAAVEVVFLCLAGTLLVRQPRRWRAGYALLVILATLNRETGLLLPLAYLATQGRCEWRWGALLLALWGLIFVGLRWAFGSAADNLSIGATFALNTGGGQHTQDALFNHAFFVPIWVMVIRHVRAAPIMLKRLGWVAAVYLALVAVFGLWDEVRLLLPLLVLWLPLALHPGDADSENRTSPTERMETA